MIAVPQASRLHRSRAAFRALWIPVLAALAMSFGLGCREPAPDEATAAGKVEPIVRTVDRGPVKLTVTAGQARISIAERLDLRIEVRATGDVEVEMPQFGESLAEFQIRDFRELPVAVDASGGRTYAQVYDLDIFLSGEYTIPGITARYRTQDAADLSELTTEPIVVSVESLLEGEFDPQKFNDVKQVVALPVDRDWRAVALVVVCAVAAVGITALLVVWLLRRGRRPEELLRVPAHEWALAQLRALADAQLIEEGRVQEFYYRLSEIARQYIERRFGLMAPERTTDEFLIEMRAGDALGAEHQLLLGEFLEACDLVKYARHEPGVAEIERAFNAARDFITETTPTAEPASTALAAQEVAA